MARSNDKKATDAKDDFGPRLRQRRKAGGMAAKDLARLAGVSPSYISQLEHGRQDHPSLEVLNALASGLGVTLSELLGDASPAEGVRYAPPALVALAAELKLDGEVVTMLSGINLDGRRPATREGWRLVLLAIQHACTQPIVLAEEVDRPKASVQKRKKQVLELAGT